MFKKLFGCGEKKKKKEEQPKSDKKVARQKSDDSAAKPKQNSSKKAPRSDQATRSKQAPAGKTVKRKKKKVTIESSHIDVTQPLEFPCTPEIVLEHHKHKPFLNENEEWLLVELNEYECLIDELEIVKTIAKHSKFFEADPPELWEEFFEFVDDMPSYDEVINYDVWQEFRDKVYAC